MNMVTILPKFDLNIQRTAQPNSYTIINKYIAL